MGKRGDSVDTRSLLLLWSKSEQRRFSASVEKLSACVNDLRVLLAQPLVRKQIAELEVLQQLLRSVPQNAGKNPQGV